VQKILGHTQIPTTQRYAHLSQERLLAATNEVANFIDSTFLTEDKNTNFIEQTDAA
jgi:hypothetical protein